MPQFLKLRPNLIISTTSSMLNATIYKKNGLLAVIDTLLTAGDSKALLDYAITLNKGEFTVINTHWHSDHCFGNRYFKLYDATVIAQEHHLQTLIDERSILRKGTSQLLEKQLVPPADLTFEDYCHIQKELISCDNAPLPDRDNLLSIRHTPGHTKDSSIVLFPEYNILAAGDTVLSAPKGKTALPYFFWGDEEELISSLQAIIDLNPELIIPGHGEPVTIDKPRRDIAYLTALQTQATHTVSKGNYDTLDQLKTILHDEVTVFTTSGLQTQDIWVPEVHTYNLDELAVKYYTLSL